ncbi:DNA/RNA helicase [Croceibacterium mercuriale]|uniref:DNA/RNA helicase n=1 Tax=Croceibacterium mercuriale TaxID=1572751 RepID=A0A0B2BS07_9SPHN|nr:TM0106 family RecB-like putative nuclease [Croceibacterium mercuriale]KHL24156.1 DNA/RNA helicase [Croceibacterium mercuriale]
MRLCDDSILHSPSDLVRHLGCAHATTLELGRLLRPEEAPEAAADDALNELVQQAGLRHEADYRDRLAADGGLVEIAGSGSLRARAEATRGAMAAGAPAIFQAAFLDAPWHGFADFLLRVEEPSALGAWSYEPVDTKLARSAKASHLVQLGLYGRMMAAVQGRPPRRVHVELGSGTRESFRLSDFGHVLDAASARYLGFVDGAAGGTSPQPTAACDQCRWRDHCDAEWLAADDLQLVCGLSAPQAEKLRAAGIATGAALAAAPEGLRVPRMAAETFAKLRAQARLQAARHAGGDPVVELLPAEAGRGFANLPEPNPADLFFDLEGDPLAEGGLDYLWGVHFRQGGVKRFAHHWAHDHAAEREAFEAMIDWFAEHLAQHPAAHIYHYAPYEITALRRLSTLHASREEVLDDLLRTRRFVDLYGLLRQAIRTSEPNLSLKTMELFFAPPRDGAVQKADQSVVEYKSWQETGDQALLDGILAYNRVDCENTEGLRNWLAGLRPADAEWRSVGAPGGIDEEKAEARLAAEAEAAALVAAIHAGPLPASESGRELVGHLTQFHRRADKPAFWAMFDRCEREPDELVDDAECIGGLVPNPDASGAWQEPERRSTLAHYRFPPQETKLRKGGQVLHAPTLTRLGTIHALDCEAGTVTLKKQLKGDDAFPTGGSAIPGQPISTAILAGAVRRVAGCWAGGGDPEEDGTPRYRALLDLIGRVEPRLADGAGGQLVQAEEGLVEAATRVCLALDRSTLFIQGPPGTGKTYTSAHAIVSLLAAGKRVGISSNSHKAVNNLMGAVERAAEARGLAFAGAKKVTVGNHDTYLDGAMFDDVAQAKDIHEVGYQLVGGTAWLFADERFDEYFDHLFVDEAGQVSLGHLLAMGAAAQNIVLVGDQMQLAQPIQGSHPGESGLSALDYLLQAEATVAPEAGILLDTSWRMHPAICRFISDAVYDGRLQAHPDCARQRLALAPGHDPALAEHGLRFVAVDHTGCGQRSDMEVARVKALAEGLIGTSFTRRDGSDGKIGWDNILIVAPYNMQVNALAAALPAGARVGTVDRFQGQEAEVVIASMATSSPADLPRHVDFFYSKNRINVAISRARTLALVVANPKLLELDAKSVDHFQLVNTLAWVVKEGAK